MFLFFQALTANPCPCKPGGGGYLRLSFWVCLLETPQKEREAPMPKINTSRAAAKKNTGLAEISSKIKALEKNSIKNVIEIGRLLHEASEQCEHGEYQDWIKREFGWSYRSALRYRNAYEFAQKCQIVTFEKLNLSLSALHLVAERKGDDEQDVREAIIKAATEGRVSHSDAQAIIEQHRRATNKLIHAYGKRFGIVSGVQDRNLCRLYEAALRSGVDEPELVERKRRHEEEMTEYYRKHAEFLATPITTETEQEYTRLIKQRRLYEGACELSWQQYSIYRDQHPDDCEPLTPDDLEYLALWTPCMVKRPQDQEAVPPEPIKPLPAEANGAAPAPPVVPEPDEAVSQLIGDLDGVTFYAFRPQHPAWPKAIEAIGGPAKLLEIITKLQAVYDERCQGSAVKAKADRAESKASSQNGRQH
jgi:hypothetical protein